MRLEKALESARAITNIEIQYDDLVWLKGRPDAPDWASILREDFTRTCHIKYDSSGSNYLSETHCESPSTKQATKIARN
jgi:hypothetical protein